MPSVLFSVLAQLNCVLLLFHLIHIQLSASYRLSKILPLGRQKKKCVDSWFFGSGIPFLHFAI